MRSKEKEAAIATVLRRIEGSAGDERERLLASAWSIGASAEELHVATGLGGDELRHILERQGQDTSPRRRGWRRR